MIAGIGVWDVVLVGSAGRRLPRIKYGVGRQSAFRGASRRGLRAKLRPAELLKTVDKLQPRQTLPAPVWDYFVREAPTSAVTRRSAVAVESVVPELAESTAERTCSAPARRRETWAVDLGSIPVSALQAVYAPVVDLCTGRTVAFDRLLQCRKAGRTEPGVLLARATAEQRLAELGRVGKDLNGVIELVPAILKRDPRLVQGIERDARRREAVARCTDLLAALGAQVVAKGVATRDARRALRDCGVRFGQGPLVGCFAGALRVSRYSDL